MEETMRSKLIALALLVFSYPSVSIAEMGLIERGYLAKGLIMKGEVLDTTCTRHHGHDTNHCSVLNRVSDIPGYDGLWNCQIEFNYKQVELDYRCLTLLGDKRTPEEVREMLEEKQNKQ